MALFSKLFGGNPRQSLRHYGFYALGEVLLIFVGITLSIWFSNWNDSRREREIEISILRELREDLSDDSIDVADNITLRERAIIASRRILDFSANQIAYNDSLNKYFSASLNITTTLAKTSAFEHLKSRGFQTITNDSLRAKIIAIYDIAYPHIHQSESRHEDLYFNFLIHFNAKRFDSSNPYENIKPLNYQSLMQDHEYKYYLRILIFYNDFILNESRSILKSQTSLRETIASELLYFDR